MNTITARICWKSKKTGELVEDNEDVKETKKYLERLCKNFKIILSSESFFIEVRDKPNIIDRLEITVFDVLRITEEGIVLYIPDKGWAKHKHGFIFLPIENIIAIHNINDESLPKPRKFMI